MANIEEAEPDFKSAADNAALVNAASALAQREEAPVLPNPLDGPLTLTAGFRRAVTKDGTPAFEEVRSAWVRELDGGDEERIARAKLRDDSAAFVNAILEAGVERLGDVTPTKDDFNSLVLGDRDFLLLEISRATYGNDLPYDDFVCYHCGETLSFVVHKDSDIPVKRLDNSEDRNFEVRLHNDRVAKCTLPTVDAASAVMDAKTEAEANTLLIAAAVSEIRGNGKTVSINGDMEVARSLGIRDRQSLVKEMSVRMPGPQYNEVRFEHPSCGKEIRLSVVLADLFLGL